jgi:rhodanese-related sulfurtransferase
MAETAQAQSEGEPTEGQVTQAVAGGPIPVDEETARQFVQDGARFVNVDPYDEFAYERIGGTQDIPLNSLAGVAEGWGKTDTIVLTSRTQPRSRSGAAYLSREGFTEVYYLSNGHNGWDGEFDGEHHRTITQPPILYFIYVSDTNFWAAPELWDDYWAVKDHIEHLEQVEQDYPGIDYRWLDLTFEEAEAFRVIEKYGFGNPNVTGTWVPQWILVDHNGDAQQVFAWPAEVEVDRVFGWIYKMSEEQGYKESLRFRPGGDFNPNDTIHQPPGVHVSDPMDR